MTTAEAAPLSGDEPTAEMKQEMLRRMLRIRLLDQAAVELHGQGHLPGPMHTSIGQEGEIVGACMALRESDYMLGNHRSHGHPIGKGGKVGPLLAELIGKRTGVCRGKGGSQHLADFSVGSLGESGIVAAGMPIATGAALSAKLRGTDQVALAFFGDGAVNAGPFHESHNLAATWRLPVIFMCEDNGYAVRTHQRETTSVKDIVQRAAGYDIPGVIVDGQDVLAVHEVVAAAVARARAGEGPTLIDAKTYRYRDHAEFGAMGLRLVAYRDDSEVEAWKRRDPITLFRDRLIAEGLLTEETAQELADEVQAEIDEGVRFAMDSPFPDPSEAYEDLYANPIPIRGVNK
jgi:pyruvate dehydrogenase E1 component alpha subunit